VTRPARQSRWTTRASALICFTVARMMCPTNGRISDQYRRRSATRDRDLPAFLTQQGGALPVGQHGEVRGNLAPTGLGEADELGLRHVAPSRHSMTGFQYFPTAAKAISRPGLSPSSNQPQPAVGDQLGKRGSGLTGPSLRQAADPHRHRHQWRADGEQVQVARGVKGGDRPLT
jgi:hypothetical protein